MQKIPLTLGIKAVLLALILTEQVTTWTAVLADMGTSLSVGLAHIFGQARFA